MSYRIVGLDPAEFRHLHALPEAALKAVGAERVRIDAKHAAPCRISLDDAEIGETVLLLSYAHQQGDTPYRQQGPIFVRETAARFEAENCLPPAMVRRPLSLRGYDAEHRMIEAELTEGADADALIARFFANPVVDYIHAHYARRGCFAAQIDRA
jgi:hypothetical protein